MFIRQYTRAHSFRLRCIQFMFTYIWCFCMILFKHVNTHGPFFEDSTNTAHVGFNAFGFKSNNSKGLHSYIDRTKRSSITRLKQQINFVLNLNAYAQNESIDRYITEHFEVSNPDPVYVFVLPENANQTLVFHRSNFSDISFPNTTSLQKMHNFLRRSEFAHLHSSQTERSSKDSSIDESFIRKYHQFMSSENDLYEAESLKIVEENVRTEKNFFQFMDQINREMSNEEISVEDNSERSLKQPNQKESDFSPLVDHVHSTDHIGKFALYNQNRRKTEWHGNKGSSAKLSWEDFGLEGWVGKLNEQHDNPKENGESMRIEFSNSALREDNLFPNKFVPILANYDPLALLTTSTTSTTPRYRAPMHDNDNMGNKKWPHLNHQFSFVQHDNVVLQGSKQRPKPPSIILSSIKQSTPNSVNLFVPSPSFESPPIHRPRPSSNRKPFKSSASPDAWDIRFNISKEILDLLALEKINLENISQALDSNSNLIVTNSRFNHKDDDVYVGRANNPFGYSTRWKLSNTSQNDVSKDELNDDGRQKRDVIDLYSMVKCATGCDPLIFKAYGCYCGFLGSGKALDGIDRCCKMHDYCYHATNCPKFLEYFVPFLWKCYRGRPLCAIDHGEWGGPNSCAAALCECDRALSNCLRRFYCPRKRAVCTSSPLRLLQNILMNV